MCVESNESRAYQKSLPSLPGPAAEVEKLHAVGFDNEEIVEIVALIAFNIFWNYLNLVAGTVIDLPVVKSHRALLDRSAGQ